MIPPQHTPCSPSSSRRPFSSTFNPIEGCLRENEKVKADLVFCYDDRSFIQEATAQRKFEDVKSLKSSLSEIRGEIERMVASSYTH